MLTRVLSDKQDALLREERALLMRLRTALARIDAADDQQEALDQSIAQLDELFLLVVVGEFNAGKSAFINALIGQPLMKEGVTPTTAVITVLEHGDQPEQTVRQANLLVIKAPIDLLREIRIVDTPGTNAIIREHETMTAEFIPRSDLVFFVTSADRPFTETERGFMEHIRGWGKKIVVVVNKSDILEGPAQVAEIRSFVADNARVAARLRARDFLRQREAGAPRQAGRAGGLGRQRLRGARELRRDHAECVRPRAVEAAESARCRDGCGRTAARARCAIVRRSSKTTSRRSSRSRASSGCISATWSATSSCAWPTSRTCCSRWSAAAISSSTTRCASAA